MRQDGTAMPLWHRMLSPSFCVWHSGNYRQDAPAGLQLLVSPAVADSAFCMNSAVLACAYNKVIGSNVLCNGSLEDD